MQAQTPVIEGSHDYLGVVLQTSRRCGEHSSCRGWSSGKSVSDEPVRISIPQRTSHTQCVHRWRDARGGDRGGAGGDRDRPAGERPRLNLAPRSVPKEEPKVDDDGFATVTKKR